MRWLRRLIRTNTRPVPRVTADIWKRRLSLAYGFFAWNALAVVAYAVYSGRRGEYCTNKHDHQLISIFSRLGSISWNGD